MMLACAVFSYVLGSISKILHRYDLLAREFKEKMKYVNKYCKMNKVPANLRFQI